MEYITEKQAKKAIIDVGQRMYTRGFVAANDGNISVRTGEIGRASCRERV